MGLTMKVRLDKLLVERELTPSRERAQAMILAGNVLVNGQKVEKAGTGVSHDAEIRLLGDDLKYVSRGGLKLEKAIQQWKIQVAGRTCLDVGASTGGFTDCLLQHGAAKVVAVDTGYGQLDLSLRNDRRVRVLEKTNARYLRSEEVTEAVSLVVVDVSFISATLVLGPVIAAVGGEGSIEGGPETKPEIIVLVKPQFEVGREQIGKGGIVRDEQLHAGSVEKVRQCLMSLGYSQTAVIESPIQGAEGNREFLLHAEV